ncbi:MAG: LamG domain-containing protein, partial [Ignavibacteria bacterium]|nr:LamG domain-containing protein [Ignavibacteria bacterium]
MNKFLLLFFLAVFSISVWSQGLVAHYPLNGNANDSSGNGNDGTLNGVTFASNNTMTFAQFTSTSYINVPDNSTFDFSNASGVTIATWIRQEQSTSGDILRKMGTSGSSDDEYGLWLSSTGQISGGLNGPGQQKILQAKSSLSLNTWTHVVFMWNKVDSKISFYINGILDTITNSTITSIQNTNAVLRIGA